MHITYVEIENFRALKKISVPQSKFTALIGENDVGKTSFLFALNAFFSEKKLSDSKDWFRGETDKDIVIALEFSDLPNDALLNNLKRADGKIKLRKTFVYGKAAETRSISSDGTEISVSAPVIQKWFSNETFHFIPVRRDLGVQFSFAEKSLLGKTLRAQIKKALEIAGGAKQVEDLTATIADSMSHPKSLLQKFLREQMHNEEMTLIFDNMSIDPIKGVDFSVNLSDEKVSNIAIENRGAGTQNSLIIALFRLVAELDLGSHFIFAMEEPENSLHPKAQRQLLSVIQEISRSSQVIVTTHSPVFIDRTSFTNNIILTRTAAGNTIAKQFNSAMLTEVRADLGIRASDALLKGGGNCAVLVEGSTEENGFPVMMEMLGMSEFQLGLSIINMGGSDSKKATSIARLLKAYDIPCIVVLDRDAEQHAKDIRREAAASLDNIRHVFCLEKGMIEDYYPLDVIAQVMNEGLSPATEVFASDFDETKSGAERINNFKLVMHNKTPGGSIEYLKNLLGARGSEILKERGVMLDQELKTIFDKAREIAIGQ